MARAEAVPAAKATLEAAAGASKDAEAEVAAIHDVNRTASRRVAITFSLMAEMHRVCPYYLFALDAFRSMAERHTQNSRTYEAAAQSLLRNGRPGDAKKITQMAARNGVTSTALRSLNKALLKVVNGPRFRKRFQHKSRNYHVVSDMDQTICRPIERQL